MSETIYDNFKNNAAFFAQSVTELAYPVITMSGVADSLFITRSGDCSGEDGDPVFENSVYFMQDGCVLASWEDDHFQDTLDTFPQVRRLERRIEKGSLGEFPVRHLLVSERDDVSEVFWADFTRDRVTMTFSPSQRRRGAFGLALEWPVTFDADDRAVLADGNAVLFVARTADRPPTAHECASALSGVTSKDDLLRSHLIDEETIAQKEYDRAVTESVGVLARDFRPAHVSPVTAFPHLEIAQRVPNAPACWVDAVPSARSRSLPSL